MGRVNKILISEKHSYAKHKMGEPGNFPMHEIDSVECIEGRGLKGDRYFEKNEGHKGQVTFISFEKHLELMSFLGKEFDYKIYRRNIFVTGIDPFELIGKKFKVNDVEFLGVEDCAPCRWMEETIGSGTYDWMSKNKSGGLRAKVLNSGLIKLNDIIVLEKSI